MALTRWVGRAIGLDVHRDFCVVAICDDGEVRSAGRVPSTPEGLGMLAQSLVREQWAAGRASRWRLPVSWKSRGRHLRFRCSSARSLSLREARSTPVQTAARPSMRKRLATSSSLLVRTKLSRLSRRSHRCCLGRQARARPAVGSRAPSPAPPTTIAARTGAPAPPARERRRPRKPGFPYEASRRP